MASVLYSEYIGGVMVSMLDSEYIGGVMVSVLALSMVDHGIEPGQVKSQTINLVFVASPLSTQH